MDQFVKAVRDVFEGIMDWELWGILGWHEIRQRYRRSTIGPFWITLSLSITIFVLGLMYGGLFKLNIDDYLPYLALGFICWSLIASFFVEGCNVFIAAEGAIRQIKIPFTVYVMRMVWRNVIVFFHNFIIYIIIAFYFGFQLGWEVLLFIPGLLLLCVNGIWAGLCFGLISVRFRDFSQIVTSIIQVLFFITPIIWKVEQLPDRAIFLTYNPFYHMIEIVRVPLLGGVASLMSWGIVGAVTVLGFVVTGFLFTRYRSRIAYWA